VQLGADCFHPNQSENQISVGPHPAALLMGLQARRCYKDVTRIAEAHSYEADALRLELEAQQKAEPPVFMPMQVIDMSNPRDKYDYDIR
jgi:hypothetical protein